LDHELPRETASVFDQDDPRAILLDSVEESREAGAALDRIGAAHIPVVESLNGLEVARSATAATASRWRLSLSLSAPTLAALEVRR
jgi:hypothetical protein